MPVIVQFDFPFSGPFGAEMHAAMKDLAVSITQETGFLWKIWTEDAKAREAGGIYLFKDRATADAYTLPNTQPAWDSLASRESGPKSLM